MADQDKKEGASDTPDELSLKIAKEVADEEESKKGESEEKTENEEKNEDKADDKSDDDSGDSSKKSEDDNKEDDSGSDDDKDDSDDDSDDEDDDNGEGKGKERKPKLIPAWKHNIEVKKRMRRSFPGKHTLPVTFPSSATWNAWKRLANRGRIMKAIDRAREYALIGNDIFGSGYDLEITIKKEPGAFVCGEETALIGSLS